MESPRVWISSYLTSPTLLHAESAVLSVSHIWYVILLALTGILYSSHSGRHAKECNEGSYDNLLMVYAKTRGI